MSAPVVRVPAPRRSVEPAAPYAGPSAPSTPGSAVRPPAPRHRIDVPAPRPATTGSPAARPVPPRTLPPAVPAAAAPATRGPAHRSAAGRHRDAGPAFPAAARTLTVLARAGSLTTLAAMVVLAAAVAGLADGTPPTGAAAEISTDGLHP